MHTLLRTKRLVWALAVAILTVLLTFTYLSGRQYVAAMQSVQRTLEVTSTIDSVVAAMIDEETGQRGFMLTKEESFLEPYQLGRIQVVAGLDKLARLTRDSPKQVDWVADLRRVIREKQAFVDQMIALSRSAEPEAALRQVQTGRGKALMDVIRQRAAEMRGEERRVLDQRSKLAARTQRLAFGAIVAGALVTALLLFGSFLALHRDAASLRRAAEELAESEERFRVLADSASDMVRVFEVDGKTWYQSPSMERLLGFTHAEISALAAAILHPEDLAEAREMFHKIGSGEVDEGLLVHRFACKNGGYRWFETNFTAMGGHPRRIQATSRDVTQRRQDTEALALRADEMRTLSLRDELTGIHNRRGFFELGEQMMRVGLREQRSLAVVFVDLDGLKPINDLHGHDAGDRAIIEAAALLKSVCGPDDVAVRLGGDEFAVLTLELDAASVAAFRARIELALAQRNARRDLPFELSFSLGVAFSATDREEALEILLARADAAMYSEKRAHRIERGLRTTLPPQGRPSLPGFAKVG
jgi:diguanylate cyclase (GGDEF)-like protein/PAS domain S-box-containing protein